MIKVEANVVGAIKRNASVRTDRNNRPYLSFIMAVRLPDTKAEGKIIDVFVSLSEAHQGDLSLYGEGVRVSINGDMDIRNKGEDLNFYLVGKTVSTENVPELDAIGGILKFRGHLKKENVYEEKTGKKGNPFIVFPAYSSEKVGETFVSTWVNFMRFPAKDAAIESIKPDWMRSKAHVDISGDLQLSSFNGKLRLSCRVHEMSEVVSVQS